MVVGGGRRPSDGRSVELVESVACVVWRRSQRKAVRGPESKPVAKPVAKSRWKSGWRGEWDEYEEVKGEWKEEEEMRVGMETRSTF